MKSPLLSRTGLVMLLLFSSAAASWGQGVAYPKIEASFNVTGISTDPVVLFDYAQTDIKVAILQPDSSVMTLPAFYDGGTTWRVRHTPTMAGVYTITNVALNGTPISISNLQPTNWTVTGFPPKPGYVLIDPSNHRRFIMSNGQRFYPLGEDIAWDTGTHTVTTCLAKEGLAHLNWARIWMDHWDGKNLDWNSDGTPPGALGVLNLTVAQKWDSIVNAAEQAGVYFQMTLQHHGQYSTSTDPNWGQNPYNTADTSSTIGFLTSPNQFFTNATARAVTKRKLRYSIARWGYSTSIMAWELFNEVQFTYAAQNNEWSIVQSWHNEMAQFMRAQDPYHHLITTSSDLTHPIWDQTDYYQHHEYPTDLITGIRDAQDISASQTVAPDFAGEIGINTIPHVGISPPVWAGLMSGQSAASMVWYWDTVDQNNDYFLMQAAADFVKLSGIGSQDVLTKSSPNTTGGTLGQLQFAPSGGWGPNAGPDTFTVGSAAPDGIGLSTAYLQGQGNRSLLPNGYTFNVNYPLTGTFNVQITQRAASGCTLQIFVDTVLITNRAWVATGSDVTSNIFTQIPISSGVHTIKLWNPGADWAKLGNITLKPYAAQLGAYQVGNTNFAAVWIWHRTNVFLATSGPSVTGTVDVKGLNPGTYSATWWDTFNAGAISSFTFTVTNSSVPVTLTTPAVTRSVALYAGLPPQAGVTPASLSASVVSNAPFFSLPVTITNGGGLPLSYSLSVTGANVGWASLSSTSGYAPRTGAIVVSVGFNPAGLAPNTYNATLVANTSDSLQPQFTIPISLTITSTVSTTLTGIEAWRLANFGTTNNTGNAADTADPDNDGLINILEYAFNLNPNVPSPNPISVAAMGGFLTVTFNRTHPAPTDLNYVAEVTDDLTTGIWNSGPSFTSQSVVDNGDGTETVTVTDLVAIGSASSHFLRIRVVPVP